MSAEILSTVRRGLIVSCQAEEGDPFHRPEYVALFARAAEMGGAAAIRAREPENVSAIRRAVRLPIIGLTKSAYPDGSVLITATRADVEALIEAGADMVAVDATHRRRPHGVSGTDFVAQLRTAFPSLFIVADVSTLAEGLDAAGAGASAVATTLAGYTPQTAPSRSAGPQWKLLRDLVAASPVPVIMEGRIANPGQARRALGFGAFAVVVGTAITRPRLVVGNYVRVMRGRAGSGNSE
jgi:putative N-acetylmannosamine-6-phosphate epimerase